MIIAAYEAKPWTNPPWRLLESSYNDVRQTEELLTSTNYQENRDVEILSIDVSRADAFILSKFKNLRLIALRATGVDRIDLNYCKTRGITVCNVPGYAENAVAEHVFALLLSVGRNMIDAVERTRKGRFFMEGLEGFELHGKTLAVIGTGSIGRRVAEIATGFGMHVVAFDAAPDQHWAARVSLSYLPLKEAVSVADVVTLHIPASPKTHHLFSTDLFNIMKDGVVIINTARGDLIDNWALLGGLNSGKVRAAGLDVLPLEEHIGNVPELAEASDDQNIDWKTLHGNDLLLHHPRVIVTPHCAFFTLEAGQRLMDETVKNIVAFAEGKPRNIVA